MGTANTVAVADPDALPEAVALVRSFVENVEAACSRFRPESELSRLNRTGGEAVLSSLLASAIEAALAAAEMTGGLVDPTVGGCLEELGYTVTFGELPADGPPLGARLCAAPDWREVRFDSSGRRLRLPAGMHLDLGASGKAWAADTAVRLVESVLGVAALVEFGGDVAVAGEPPPGGWPVGLAGDSGRGPEILVFDGGLATSGPGARRWRRGGRDLHHILDPATGRPARTPWASVSVAGATCLEANAAATAAVILGRRAVAWLAERQLPARLIGLDGTVSTTPAWAA